MDYGVAGLCQTHGQRQYDKCKTQKRLHYCECKRMCNSKKSLHEVKLVNEGPYRQTVGL